MPLPEKSFYLAAKRTRWFSGYNSNLHALIAVVQDEIGDIITRSGMLKKAPFSAINLSLQFSNYPGKPRIHFIDKKESSLCVEAAVDWREHVKDDTAALKAFFLACVAECIVWVAGQYSLELNTVHQLFAKCSIQPTDAIVHGEELEESIVQYGNDLEIAVKLSNGDFGAENEIEPCQKLAMELAKYGTEEDGTLAGGGFYRIYVRCDQPVQVFRQVEAMLRNRRLRRGSYAEAHYLSGIYFNHDRFDFT